MRALLLCFFVVIISFANAQNSVLPGGGNTTDAGGSISYSLGYLANLNGTSADGSLTGGLQQPYEISVITGVRNLEISLDIKSYPNPASQYLMLSTGNTSLRNLSYTLIDSEGKTVRQGRIHSSQTTIDLTGLKSTVYNIRVCTGQKTVKSFRIIKTN